MKIYGVGHFCFPPPPSKNRVKDKIRKIYVTNGYLLQSNLCLFEGVLIPEVPLLKNLYFICREKLACECLSLHKIKTVEFYAKTMKSLGIFKSILSVQMTLRTYIPNIYSNLFNRLGDAYSRNGANSSIYGTFKTFCEM